jgi:hypothetical protein
VEWLVCGSDKKMRDEFRIVSNFYTQDQLLDINTYLEKDSEKCGAKDEPSADARKTLDAHTVFWGHAKEYLGKMEELTHHLNRYHFGLDIYLMTGYDCINYNVYTADKQSEYTWHKDGRLDAVSDIKLTVILNASTESYEGGDFEFFLNGPQKVLGFEPGSFIIFPSWIQHRVTPVTKGVRKTVSFWIQGPRFK